MESSTDIVVVATFFTEHEADLAVSLLASCGLAAARFADDCGGTDPALGFGTRARVCVQRSSAPEALEILRNSQSVPSSILDEDVPELSEDESE